MSKIIAALLFVIVCFVGPVLAQDSDPPKKDDPPAKKKDRKKDDIFREKGSLLAKDSISKARKVHLYKMTPGKTYIIEMLDQNAITMDPYLYLEDSAGATITQDDDGGVNQNARIVFTPTKEDTYKIIATTCDLGRSGNYLLTVHALLPSAVPVALGGKSQTFQIPVDIGDLTITPLAPWGMNPFITGSNADTHGYIEYRFLIENNSDTKTHKVTLNLPRHNNLRYGNILQSLKKTVEVGPEGTAQVSLFQPDLPMGNATGVLVEIDGRRHDEQMTVNLLNNRGNRFNSMYSGGPRSGSIATIIVAGDTLQQRLRGYVYKSAVGVVTKPPTGGYSSTGGTYQEPGPYFNKPYNYYGVHHFQVAPEAMDVWSRHWLGYSSCDGVALTPAHLLAAPQDVLAALWQYVECGGTLLVLGDYKLPESWGRAKELASFTIYYPGFGQCIVAKQDVIRWDPDDWRVVTGMWERSLSAWQSIRNPTDANREFEIVKGLAIPVRGMFIAMIVFVVVIGPINVYWLSRSKRRIWLLWTVPVFALLTCAALVGFMVATEGWHGHVRAEGVTVLDESAQRATTLGWLGFYCPTTPSGGLRFSPDCELTPHLLSGRAYYQRTAAHAFAIEWTSDQHLTEGWVTAKVPIHFMMRKNEKRLERVTVRKNDDGSVTLVNGLGKDIRVIWLAGPDRTIYTASRIVAGAEAKLQPTQDLCENNLTKLSDFFAGSWNQGYDALNRTPAAYLRPGCYLADLEDSPFFEQGLRHVQTKNLRSVVFGIMKEPL